MKFDYNDKNDGRVVELSPYAFDYPGEVEDAPDATGVYMFLGANEEVVYIGKASGGRLRDEILTKKGLRAELGAVEFRWFRTNSDAVAGQLEADWIKKYHPTNNVYGP